MPGIPFKPMMGALVAACLAGGCANGILPARKAETTSPDVREAPLYIAGTVAEYAVLVGGNDLPVQGYGLVAGLGTNGCRQVPAHLRSYFSQLLLKSKMLPAGSGTDGLSSTVILGDPDTAVVDVYGLIPPGAPAGARFDVQVSALPETQTRSLDGGVLLLPVEMYLAVPESMGGRQSKVLAEVDGTVMVNPFLDADNPDDLPALREGRVVGGGKVKMPRPLRLQLLRGDYHLCNLIQRRINERFGPHRVAVARDDSTIDISIPPEFSDDYGHFLRLVTHLPVRYAAGSWEGKAREVLDAMTSSAADHHELSLVLEAIGKQVIPMARKLYGSANPPAAFYAARAGARLGDVEAVGVLAAAAADSGSPLQVTAAEELSRYGRNAKALITLRDLIDDDNQLVRIAAYESLAKVGDSAKVTRISLPDQFDLDIVDCASGGAIYVSQSLHKRIVVFGRGIPVRRPVFYKAPEDMVIISAAGPDDKLTVYRKIPGTSRTSEVFVVEPTVRDLVKLLGTLPAAGTDGKIYGLGLTYGQVVAVLYKMCKDGDIPAEFRLQVLPEVRRIYRDTATVGRGDMPGL